VSAPLPVLLVVFAALGLAPLALGSYVVVQGAGTTAQLAWFGMLALGILVVLAVAGFALLGL
jgi:hypothetical protein